MNRPRATSTLGRCRGGPRRHRGRHAGRAAPLTALRRTAPHHVSATRDKPGRVRFRARARVRVRVRVRVRPLARTRHVHDTPTTRLQAALLLAAFCASGGSLRRRSRRAPLAQVRRLSAQLGAARRSSAQLGSAPLSSKRSQAQPSAAKRSQAQPSAAKRTSPAPRRSCRRVPPRATLGARAAPPTPWAVVPGAAPPLYGPFRPAPRRRAAPLSPSASIPRPSSTTPLDTRRADKPPAAAHLAHLGLTATSAIGDRICPRQPSCRPRRRRGRRRGRIVRLVDAAVAASVATRAALAAAAAAAAAGRHTAAAAAPIVPATAS